MEFYWLGWDSPFWGKGAFIEEGPITGAMGFVQIGPGNFLHKYTGGEFFIFNRFPGEKKNMFWGRSFPYRQLGAGAGIKNIFGRTFKLDIGIF